MKLLENAQQLPLADMEKSSEQQEAKGSYRQDKKKQLSVREEEEEEATQCEKPATS